MRGRRFTPEALKVLEAVTATPGMDLHGVIEATGLERRRVSALLGRLVFLGHARSHRALAPAKRGHEHTYTPASVPSKRDRGGVQRRLAPPKTVVPQPEGIELLNKAFGVGRPQLPVRPQTVRRFIEEEDAR